MPLAKLALPDESDSEGIPASSFNSRFSIRMVLKSFPCGRNDILCVVTNRTLVNKRNKASIMSIQYLFEMKEITTMVEREVYLTIYVGQKDDSFYGNTQFHYFFKVNIE